MSALIAVCIVLLAIAGAITCSVCVTIAAPAPSQKADHCAASPLPESREQLRQKLLELEKKPAPERAIGAMCYLVPAPPNRVEYVCPACGERSMYTNNMAVSWLVKRDLDAMRKSLAQMPTNAPVSLALDESALCAKCSPTCTVRCVALVATYADKTTHRTTDVRRKDFDMLLAFFSGKNQIKEDNDGTTPLKKYLPRLRELLGVSDNAPLPQPDKKN